MKSKKDYLFILFIFVVAFCLYGLPNFYAPDETRYSEVAREMLANKDFLVPYINGIVFFHKAPIVYWITCFFMSVFGENTWGARLANPFLLLISLFFTYYAVKKVLESRALALISVFVMLTSLLTLFVGRYLNIDLGIAVFLNMTMLSYWISLKYRDDYKRETLWLLIAFVFSGLAVMTKGLVGIVFPMAIVGIYSIVMWEWKRLFDIRLYLGLVIVAVISAPWIIAVNNQHPDFAYYYIMVQQILRYSTDEQNREVLKVVYFAAFLGALFPWFGFLPQALKKFFTRDGFKSRKHNSHLWFLFVWGIFIFVFFGMSKSFLFGYLSPVILPFAILIAVYLKDLQQKQNFSKMDSFAIGLPILVFALLPIASVVITLLPMVRDNISNVILLSLPIGIAAVFVVIRSIQAFRYGDIKKIVILFGVMMMVVANFGYGVGEYLDQKSVKKLADDINIIYKKYPDAELYDSHRFYELGFYTKHIPVMVNSEDELTDVAGFENSGAEKYLISYDDFIKDWNNSKVLSLAVIRNRPNTHLKEDDKSLVEYKAEIQSDKFFILDKTSYATLVASHDVAIKP